MVCWAAISLMAGPGVAWAAVAPAATAWVAVAGALAAWVTVASVPVAWAAGADTAPAADTAKSPAAAIAAAMTFRFFSTRHPFLFLAQPYPHARRARNRRH
jgi:hypothetical protein